MKSILSKDETAIKAGVPSKRVKLRQAYDPKLYEGVLMWLKQAREQNFPVSGDETGRADVYPKLHGERPLVKQF